MKRSSEYAERLGEEVEFAPQPFQSFIKSSRKIDWGLFCGVPHTATRSSAIQKSGSRIVDVAGKCTTLRGVISSLGSWGHR